MSVTISISDQPEDVWQIRSWVYRWLVRQVGEQRPKRPEIVKRLEICGYFNGISLDSEFKESPALAKEIAECLKNTIEVILSQKVPVTDDDGERKEESEERVYASLNRLSELLQNFPTPLR